MPKVRFRLPEIKGIDPAVENRNTDEIRVLDGRNYFWDSKGPKPLFGTRLLAQGQVIEDQDGIVQSIEIGKQSFVFTSKKVWILNDAGTAFTQIYDLTPAYGAAVDPWRRKWTAAYLSKGIYFAHYHFGLFKCIRDGLSWQFVPKTQDDIPGIPYQPIAVTETSGRLVILGRKYLGWSASGNAERWIPELGGAGQQLLSDRVAGRPITLEAYQTGALIWTEEDCLIAEFIGGDNVFRYDRMQTEHIPMNPWCVERLPDGSQLIMTKQGLHRTVNASIPTPLTPIFNEFFRRRLSSRDFLQVRLSYIPEYDMLFVQCRDTTPHYVETFILSLNLDRWGLLSEQHFGLIRYRNERGAFGYVDGNGVAHKFVEFMRSREQNLDEYVGLDSMIEIGYIKPPELHGEIDSLQEMQEIFVGGDARPSWSQATVIDLGEIPPLECESQADVPALTIAVALSEAQLTSNWNSSYLLAPEDWWDNIVNFAYAVNYDTGEAYTYVTHAGDWTEPGYRTDSQHLQVMSSEDKAFESTNDPGTFGGGRTAFMIWDFALAVDRHDGDVWAIHDYDTSFGGTLTRAVKANAYAFQENKYFTTHASNDPEHPDTGLGGLGGIVGFTEDNIVIYHETIAAYNFKFETLNKDTMARVAQGYFQAGSPGAEAIESPPFWGLPFFVVGPDNYVYYAASKNLSIAVTPFANGTASIIHRYNISTGSYTDITPWDSDNLPVSNSNATATNFGVKHMFYCRPTNRLIIIWCVRPAVDVVPLNQFDRAGIWEISAMSFDDYTWEHLGQMPQTLFFDADGVATPTIDHEDTAFFVNGLAVMNARQNHDALPMAAPCMNYLRTVEYMYSVVGGSVVIGDYSDHDKSGARITVRDPAQNYAVIEQFWDTSGRYADLYLAVTGGAGKQFLKGFIVAESSSDIFKCQTGAFLQFDYLPTRGFFSISNSNSIENYSFATQTPDGPTWNFESNFAYLFLTA